MPNIDTCGANLSSFRQTVAGNMLGRLRVAAAAAPLVPTNGNFYTADDLQPRAQAAVVVDGRITFVGAGPDALRRAPPGAQWHDLPGTTVLPGLTEGTKRLAELKNKLRERAATGPALSSQPDRTWIPPLPTGRWC